MTTDYDSEAPISQNDSASSCGSESRLESNPGWVGKGHSGRPSTRPGPTDRVAWKCEQVRKLGLAPPESVRPGPTPSQVSSGDTYFGASTRTLSDASPATEVPSAQSTSVPTVRFGPSSYASTGAALG